MQQKVYFEMLFVVLHSAYTLFVNDRFSAFILEAISITESDKVTGNAPLTAETDFLGLNCEAQPVIIKNTYPVSNFNHFSFPSKSLIYSSFMLPASIFTQLNSNILSASKRWVQ